MATFNFHEFFSSRKKLIASIAALILLVGVAANGAGHLNNSDSGYLMCVNSKTKVVTHPGTSKCPKGSTNLVIGAKGNDGSNGVDGLTGATGLNGREGKDGKTIWNGIKDPEITWGSPGDMFINATTKTLFGPKDLDGTWPAGVSLVGPKGDQGPIGLTGTMGPQGPGGSGPAGAAGATGADGTAGTNGQGPLYTKTVSFSGTLTANTNFNVINISLPVGTFLVEFSGFATGFNGGDLLACFIDGTADEGGIQASGASIPNDVRVNYTNRAILTITSARTVNVGCGTQAAHADMYSMRITALLLSSLVDQS